jgi:hypothetical protein
MLATEGFNRAARFIIRTWGAEWLWSLDGDYVYEYIGGRVS